MEGLGRKAVCGAGIRLQYLECRAVDVLSRRHGGHRVVTYLPSSQFNQLTLGRVERCQGGLVQLKRASPLVSLVDNAQCGRVDPGFDEERRERVLRSLVSQWDLTLPEQMTHLDFSQSACEGTQERRRLPAQLLHVTNLAQQDALSSQ